MKKITLSHMERRFLFAAAAVLAVCLALIVWEAVPFRGETSSAPLDPLSELMRVDLNTAGLEALSTLPGIGEKRAEAIVEYRRQNGKFLRVEDAADVPGLTEEIVRSWGELACVS